MSDSDLVKRFSQLSMTKRVNIVDALGVQLVPGKSPIEVARNTISFIKDKQKLLKLIVSAENEGGYNPHKN